MGNILYFFSHIKFFFVNLWQLITRGRLKTHKEKLFDLAKIEGYSSIHKIPKGYKGKRKYKKAPAITNRHK